MFEIRQEKIAKRREPARFRVWYHTTQRHLRQQTTQQIKLMRAHVLVEQLRAVCIRDQLDHALGRIERLNQRRFRRVAALVEEIDRAQTTWLICELPDRKSTRLNSSHV